MGKLIIILFGIIIFSLTISAMNNSETCSTVYDFIISHYNMYDQKLEFTDEDFDLLQMQTTKLPDDLKNDIVYYEDLCDQELPFIVYNNEWPGNESKIIKEQTIKEGFNSFIDVLKSDMSKLIIGLIIAILLIWLVGKYS